jgi:hypothetical protein
VSARRVREKAPKMGVFSGFIAQNGRKSKHNGAFIKHIGAYFEPNGS